MSFLVKMSHWYNRLYMNKKERKKHNDRILARWKNGENMATCSSEDTWWPDRSKGFIKKNKKKFKVIEGDKK